MVRSRTYFDDILLRLFSGRTARCDVDWIFSEYVAYLDNFSPQDVGQLVPYCIEFLMRENTHAMAVKTIAYSMARLHTREFLSLAL